MMSASAAASTDAHHQPISFWRALVSPITVKRALKVGLVVGTILVAINQGILLWSGRWPPLWQIIATYCVPYCVSSYSTAMFMVELDQDPYAPTEGNS